MHKLLTVTNNCNMKNKLLDRNLTVYAYRKTRLIDNSG